VCDSSIWCRCPSGASRPQLPATAYLTAGSTPALGTICGLQAGQAPVNPHSVYISAGSIPAPGTNTLQAMEYF
jgi:hypothetical protein